MRRRSIAIASSSWCSNLNYYVLLFENGTSTKMCNYLLVEYLESLLFQTSSPWAQLLYTFIFIQTYHLYTHLHTHAHHTNRWMARIKSLFQGVMCAIVIYCKLLVLLCRRIFRFASSLFCEKTSRHALLHQTSPPMERCERKGGLLVDVSEWGCTKVKRGVEKRWGEVMVFRWE